MGDHLEVICLFQAAEIERLTDFLEIYKFKYGSLNEDSKISRESNSIVTPMRSRSKN